MPAEHGEHHEESDDIGHRDRPALAEPAPDRFRFRIHVGQRHAGGRSEPDHRAAEAHGVGQIAPVVTALLQRQRGQRDVVEHRGNEAEAERGLPRGDRQRFHRHQGSRGDQRQQEDGALECLRQHLPVRAIEARGQRESPPRPRGRAPGTTPAAPEISGSR